MEIMKKYIILLLPFFFLGASVTMENQYNVWSMNGSFFPFGNMYTNGVTYSQFRSTNVDWLFLNKYCYEKSTNTQYANCTPAYSTSTPSSVVPIFSFLSDWNWEAWIRYNVGTTSWLVQTIGTMRWYPSPLQLWTMPSTANNNSYNGIGMQIRDSIRIFTNNIFVAWGAMSLPLWYTPSWEKIIWKTDQLMNVYTKWSTTAKRTIMLDKANSVWDWNGATVSWISCDNGNGIVWNNYCASPKLYTYVWETDYLDPFISPKILEGVLVTKIHRNIWEGNTNSPYSVAFQLSGSAMKFTVYNCVQWDPDNLRSCTVVTNGITPDIFNVNYSLLNPTALANWTQPQFLSARLFGKGNTYITNGWVMPLENYFRSIDTTNKRLYFNNTSDTNGVTQSVWNDYLTYTDLWNTWNFLSWYNSWYTPWSWSSAWNTSTWSIQNTVASCAWHWNDPNYPWCVLAVITGEQLQQLNAYSPVIDPLIKSQLQLMSQSWDYLDNIYNDCLDNDYYNDHIMVCDNAIQMVSTQNGNFGSWLLQCPPQFLVATDFDLKLKDIAYIGGFLDSFGLWDFNILWPFSCIAWAMKGGWNNAENIFSLNIDSATSLVEYDQSDKNSRNLLWNLIAAIPALYIIFKKWLQ